MITETGITETLRRVRLAEINTEPAERPTLGRRHGQVWDSRELSRDFVVIGYMAPFVVVHRKADGIRGSLEFQHHPRFHFNWREDQQCTTTKPADGCSATG
jgi:hypothetical protein